MHVPFGEVHTIIGQQSQNQLYHIYQSSAVSISSENEGENMGDD